MTEVYNTVKASVEATISSVLQSLYGAKQQANVIYTEKAPQFYEKAEGLKNCINKKADNVIDYTNEKINQINELATYENAEKLSSIVANRCTKVNNNINTAKIYAQDKYNITKNTVKENFTHVKDYTNENFTHVKENFTHIKDYTSEKYNNIITSENFPRERLSSARDSFVAKYNEISIAVEEGLIKVKGVVYENIEKLNNYIKTSGAIEKAQSVVFWRKSYDNWNKKRMDSDEIIPDQDSVEESRPSKKRKISEHGDDDMSFFDPVANWKRTRRAFSKLNLWADEETKNLMLRKSENYSVYEENIELKEPNEENNTKSNEENIEFDGSTVDNTPLNEVETIVLNNESTVLNEPENESNINELENESNNDESLVSNHASPQTKPAE